MSDDNSDSAPSQAHEVRRGGVAEGEESEGSRSGPGAGSPGLSVSSEANSGREGSPLGAGAGGGSGSEGGGSGEMRGARLEGPAPPPPASSDDTDAHSNGNSSGNDSAAQESEGQRSQRSSQGRQSTRSSNSSSSHNGKDSAMILETTESNKSSNSHSPSPPSSSIAYSLLSASSEHDHPSTSGCSSDQSARVKTQKELMSALKELKIRVPADRKGRSRSSTLAALQHALTCVKQVRANQEYYHQWAVEDNQNSSLDLSTYTIDELENITSEYTLKNTDTFSVAVSFLSGKVVYASPQAAYVLRCKADRLQGALFSRLLAPQDVSMFYSSTVPCRLPVWSACTGKAASPLDCAQEKSMFCRLSGGREREGELRYSPFRLTPYQLTLRDTDHAAPQPCCLIIAERVHSGYEAPRIPPDKRIFTTSHTPSCVFQEVDERAVPLLGYLPQDLVGTPVLLYLHPEDRPAMVAIHKKILQLAGQPLDHSPLRVCARSGEYLTIDTSWSCFVNPWSRKVAFIIGRHKVRTSPLNEDVFAPPCGGLLPSMVPEIHQLSSQIHRLLLQPVHSSSSLGYCSVGSNGSHEPYLSLASSSDSTGAPAEDTPQHQPMTFQQICKDVHMVKNHGQKVFIESRSRPPACKHTSTGVVLPRSSSQAVRPVPEAVKEAVPQPCVLALEERKELPSPYSYQQINCLDSIIRYLDSCNVPSPVKRKCGSSSNSDDDKHPSRAEAQAAGKDIVMMEETPSTPTPTPTPAPAPTPAPTVVALPPPVPQVPTPPAAERDSREARLTKEVLSVHTQQEELAFLQRFRELSQLRVFEPQGNPNQRRHSGAPHSKGVRSSRDYPMGGSSARRGSRTRAKRLKQQEPSERSSSVMLGAAALGLGVAGGPGASLSPPHLPLGPHTSSSSWPPSVGSQASLPPLPYHPGLLPTYPLSVYPAPPVSVGHRSPQAAPQGGPFLQDPQTSLHYPQQPQLAPTAAPPMVAPMVAFVLPNYMFPQLGAPALTHPYFSPTPIFPFPPGPVPAPQLHPQHPLLVQPTLPIPTPAAPVSVAAAPSLPQDLPQLLSRSSTPQSCSQPPPDREGVQSPLFQSRCSSPLNLLQLEELPNNRQEGNVTLQGSQAQPPQATPTAGVGSEWVGQQGVAAVLATPTPLGSAGDHKQGENVEAIDCSNQDTMSTSSDLLDLLLQEDARSGTGSAASGSGSLGSGSNGCSTSGSGTRSSQSSHTSKYFGSVDSSENDLVGKKRVGQDSDQFIKYVLQDPIWLLMANTDEKVMMTYQLPSRDRAAVLRSDREALRAMQKQQPRFSEEQKRELSEVHPWIRTGQLPRAINITGCVGCNPSPPSLATPFDVELHDMELGGVLGSPEEGPGKTPAATESVAMEQEGTRPCTHGDDQEMLSEERGALAGGVLLAAAASMAE
ncbi:period circadian protein homolog 1b isoform X2 [Amia ocellicauda]|uniref:period circadian protein homolog 1b isoform X2 n=1 Tax=Amia ocellicauda TaxID=2972642 RepID=UPI00346396D9